MKYLIPIFICLLAINIALGQEPQFLKTILDTKKRPNTFLVIDVESKRFSGKVVTENSFLFSVLSSQKSFTVKNYEEFMVSLLLSRKKLRLNGIVSIKNGYFLKVKGINSISFMPLKDVPSVNQIAEKGCKEFINYYFDEYLSLKGQIPLSERNAVINKLFNWGIPSQIGDMQATVFLVENEAKCPT